MIGGTWRCNVIPKGEPKVDPIEEEFFVREDAAEKLVREAIQNSLDARLDATTPVRVRFQLHSPNRVDEDERRALLEGLRRHAEATRLPDLPRAEDTMRYLVIEDFGTRGLRGDPAQEHDDEAGGLKNDFFWFWRNWARSSKEGSNRGRWGVGKTVFPASSAMNAFFGLSRTANGVPLLMGQAVLKVHRIEGADYSPYVYFARFDANLPLPLADAQSIGVFSRIFGLTRQSESGLSIVVPWVVAEACNPKSIARAAIQHFFHPIALGELIVEVHHQDEHLILSADSVDVQCSALSGGNFDGAAVLRVLALTRVARDAMANGTARELPSPPAGTEPKWETVLPEGPLLNELRKEFDDGSLLSLRVPLSVCRRNVGARHSQFHVFVRRERDERACGEYYVREGLTIPDIRRLRGHSVSSMLVVQSGPLSDMLGDAENPAHRDWEERSRKLKVRYELGASTVRFVKNAISEIVKRLTTSPDQVDDRLLGDVFFVPEDPGSREPRRRRGGRDPKVPPTPPPPPPPPAPRRLSIGQTAGGLRVRAGPAGCVGAKVRIRMAYDVPRGNPFTAYEAADFKLGSGEVKYVVTGGAVMECRENLLVVRATDPTFEVEFGGFDVNRDLIVDARVVEEGAKSDGGEA